MRRVVAIGAFLVIVFAGNIWYSSPRQAPQQHSRPSSLVPQDVPTSPPLRDTRKFVQLPASEPGNFDPTLPQWQEWNQRKADDPYWEWKVPINFYGRVVDYDDGKPIEGVHIEFSWTDLSPAGASQRATLSDATGSFSLAGVTGKSLIIGKLEKDGYIRSRADRSSMFEYAAFFDPHYHLPDPAGPIVFRMKRKARAEPLVHREMLYGLALDGTPHYVNLRTGKKTVGDPPTGDLMLRFTRSDSDDIHRPDWVLTIQGVGEAGLSESSEEFMFEAPPDGYLRQVKIEQKSSAPEYQSQLVKEYYVKLADGETYARIEAHVFSKYNKEAAINLVVYLNPKPGSRNLEYDPKQAAEMP